MKNIYIKIKDILKIIEKILFNFLGFFMFVCSISIGVTIIIFKTNNVINFSLLQAVTLVFSPFIVIPAFFTIIAGLFCAYIGACEIFVLLSDTIEAFSLFRKRRNVNFFKALFYTLKSKTVRRVSFKYLEQKIQSHNKFFIKYRKKSKSSMNYELLSACRKGELEEVKYILTNPELKVHADINFEDKVTMENALSEACESGNLDIVDYLLFSKELKENINIEKSIDSAFYEAFRNGHVHILKYLIFQAKIKKTEYIKKIIANPTPKYMSDDMDSFFRMLELNENLNNELAHNPDNKEKITKI
jgi:hypothetical protein